MNHTQRLLLLLCAGCLTACDKNAPPAPPAAVQGTAPISLEGALPVTDIERMLGVITELSADEYGGRAPMSRGEQLTLTFIEQQFRSIGLQPLFGASFLQAVDITSIQADPATANMTFHLQDRDRSVAYADEMVLATQRAIPEARVENSEVVFVGYGINAPEYAWNDYADIDVTGKTVLILVNDPGFATQDPARFNGNAMTYYGRWTYKYEEAARQGAAAAVIIHDTAPAAYGWEVVRNSWTGPQFHLDDDQDGTARSVLISWVQKDVARELIEAAGLDLAALEQQASTAQFRAVNLGSTLDASVQNQIIKNQSYNIGAMLPGASRPEELFIYTGHWDHLGINPDAAPGEDAIYNGAVDNASGIAALLELARSFSALPRTPARSIGFLAVTAEESGLLGSAWYAEHPPIPMRQTVGGINLDAMHVYGPTHDIVVVGYGSSELEDLLRQYAARQHRTVKPEEHPERGGYYRSDHFNFAKKGVPMLYAKAGSEHTELGPDYIPARNDDYLQQRYHSPRDEINQDWDLRGLAQDIELWFSIGLNVSDSDAWPHWYEGNEFRAIRDQSRSGGE